MTYKVMIAKKAERALSKLDRKTARTIINWIKQNLEGCENPRAKGKSLSGNFSGKWRYRVGDYRILSEINDDKILILVIDIGHRKHIYKVF